MTTYTLDHPDKGLISYTDKKRYLWLGSVFMPIFPMMGIFASTPPAVMGPGICSSPTW